MTIEKPKRKRGPRPKPEHRKNKPITVSLTPLAFKKYLQLLEPSKRISKFLERIDPAVDN